MANVCSVSNLKKKIYLTTDGKKMSRKQVNYAVSEYNKWLVKRNKKYVRKLPKKKAVYLICRKCGKEIFVISTRPEKYSNRYPISDAMIKHFMKHPDMVKKLIPLIHECWFEDPRTV